MGREERTCAGTQSAAHLPGDEEQPLAVGCGLVGSTAVLGAQLGWADRLSPLPTEHGQARQEGLWVCQDPHPAAPGGAAAHAAGMLLLQVRALGWGMALCVLTASRSGGGGGKGRDLWQGDGKEVDFQSNRVVKCSFKLCFNCLDCENQMY